MQVSKYYLKYITGHNIEQSKCADNTSIEESVDNDGESVLRALARALARARASVRVRVSDARARELSVAAVSAGPARHLLSHT